MKKQPINFSWPAELSDFSQDKENENFSRGKLKVFYKGETADHRFFSDDFSSAIIESLPYTPVVSSYDEEKEDFVGHAREQQIFGIVDPCTKPSFQTLDDGKVWAICDVVLYTERPDRVGELAKQIEGHPQSLELDPSSVKYVVNYDEKKHFKNIEFTAGRFVGVSVLGNDQKPAFTGSAFFSCDEKFEAKMKILREYCESEGKDNDQSQNGGERMNLEEFMKLSWGDVSAKVNQAIFKEYENDAYTMLVDMFEDSAIVRFYYYVEGTEKLMRVKYSCNENGEVTLGDVNEVRITYEDVTETTKAEINMGQTDETSVDAVSDHEVSETDTDVPAESEQNQTEETFEEEQKTQTTVTEENPTIVVDATNLDAEKLSVSAEEIEVNTIKVEDTPIKVVMDEEVKVQTEEVKDESEQSEVTKNSEDNTDSAHVDDVEITPNLEKVSVTDEQNSNDEKAANSSTTSLTESERQEFEALKREKKLNIVNSYKECLTEEEFASFVELANSDITEDSLELKLLKIYKRAVQSTEDKQTFRAFAFDPRKENANESALDAFVRKNKR